MLRILGSSADNKGRALGAREHSRSVSCERNRDEGRNEREKRRGEGINDTKTAIPTFRPCMAVPGRIREYRVRTFHREEAWQFYASARGEEEKIGGRRRMEAHLPTCGKLVAPAVISQEGMSPPRERKDSHT